MMSRAVRVWAIKTNVLGIGKKARKSYTVRWTVDGGEKSRTFGGRALADNFRSDLMQAFNRGEAFDTESGLPESMIYRLGGISVLDFAMSYMDMKWPGSAATSRACITEALSVVLPVLVDERPNRPDDETLRLALRNYLLPPALRKEERTPDVDTAIIWLESASLPIARLADAAIIRPAVDRLARRLDGTPSAATTRRRRRSVLYNLLQYAVELEKLDFNPIDKLRVRSSRAKIADSVDRRVVVSPRQARELLIAVTYVGGRTRRGERLMAFYACLYFAAMRPGEARGLRDRDCYLPVSCEACGADLTAGRRRASACSHDRLTAGWGRLTLEKNRPQSAKRWTDTGETHDERGLKHRGQDEPRGVPIPSELVAILLWHIKRFGVAKDGRLFTTDRGNDVAAASYTRVWKEARRLALTPQQVDSPLAGRPYDLRHAGVSLWLNAGVAAPEVADRAGHSVDVLLRVYAKCIDGQEETVNRRIAAALGEPECWSGKDAE